MLGYANTNRLVIISPHQTKLLVESQHKRVITKDIKNCIYCYNVKYFCAICLYFVGVIGGYVQLYISSVLKVFVDFPVIYHPQTTQFLKKNKLYLTPRGALTFRGFISTVYHLSIT